MRERNIYWVERWICAACPCEWNTTHNNLHISYNMIPLGTAVQIKSDIVTEKFYLRLVCVFLSHCVSPCPNTKLTRSSSIPENTIVHNELLSFPKRLLTKVHSVIQYICEILSDQLLVFRLQSVV